MAPPNRPPVFVVGTGRCGSTVISEMVRENPSWCSISECFAALDTGVFPPGRLSGQEMVELLSTPRLGTTLLVRHRIEPPELCYSLDRPGARYGRETGVAPIAATTLPHLTDDPDGLLEQVVRHVARQPAATAARHYRALFDWIAGERAAHTWFERSGGSLSYVDEIIGQFPDARFVHIYRNGIDTALSMARHSAFRLLVARVQMTLTSGVDPYVTSARPPQLTDGELADLLPERFSADALMAHPMPLRWFAALWSRVTTRGLRELGGVHLSRVHHLSFEALLADPAHEARRLALFVDGSYDDAWVERASSLVRPGARATSVVPAPDVAAALAPGSRAISALQARGSAAPGRRRRHATTPD